MFYTLGALSSFLILKINKNIEKSTIFLKKYNIFFIIFSICIFVFLLNIYLFLTQNLHPKVFLVGVGMDLYQRPGALMTILFLLYILLFVNIYLKNIEYINSFKNRAFRDILFFIFIINIVFTVVLAQLIGSNNATVNLFGLTVVSLFFYIFINFTKSRRLVECSKIILKELFLGKIATKIVKSFFIMFIFVLVLAILFLLFSNIDLSRLRIFGFDSDVGSISSRIELYKNFFYHFNYNPIFGNMAVDKILTGSGTYIHSFLLSILTHLGIVGLFLFLTYIFLAIKEKLSSKRGFDNFFTIVELMIFFGILLVSTVGTFFTYTPMWFLLGLVFTPFKIINKGKKL